MKKRQLISIVSIIGCVVLSVVFLTNRVAFADPEGGAGGGGGTGGGACAKVGSVLSYQSSYNTCTTYGSSWRYYTTSSDSITTNSWGDSAPSGTITGCKEAGGYWRYAFETYKTTMSGYTVTAVGGNNNLQVGIGMIGRSTSSSCSGVGCYAYRSEMFGDGGSMMYYDTGAVSSDAGLQAQIDAGNGSTGILGTWGYVKQKFQELKNYDVAHGTNYSRGYEWNVTSALGWFCFGGEIAGSPSFTSTSTASINGDTAGTNVSKAISAGQTSAKVTFKHTIKNSGDAAGAATYTITRQKGSDTATEVKTGTTSSLAVNGTETVYNSTIIVPVGKDESVKICQKVTPAGGETNTPSTACATITRPSNTASSCPLTGLPGYQDTSATATASKGTTSAISGIKGGVQTLWTKNTIYLKPNDTVEFAHCYFPGAAGVSYLDADDEPQYVDSVNKFSISSSNIKTATGVNPAFSSSRSFSVSGATLTGTAGRVNSAYVHTNNTLTIKTGHASTTLTQKISSSYMGTNQVSSDWKTITSRTSSGESNTVKAYIPYNYKTSIRAELSGTNILYGGASASAQAGVEIGTRENATTGGTYATETPSTEVRLVSFYLNKDTAHSSSFYGSGNTAKDPCRFYQEKFSSISGCQQIQSITQVWNQSGSTTGSSNVTSSVDIDVEDKEVGTLFCVAAGIHTVDSGTDTNNGEKGADGVNTNWNISPANCRRIAKKPTFSVTGGGVSTAGDVKASTTTKNGTFYSSWSEFLAISSYGTILSKDMGITSGNYNQNGIASNTEALICKLSPLTIANNKCKDSKKTGNSGVAFNSTSVNRVVKRYTLTKDDDNSAKTLSNINLSRDYTLSGSRYRYTYLSGDATINEAGEDLLGITHIIYSRGNITINTNLKTSPNVTDISDTAQYIIISEKDIKIAAGVQRIDAWLVAKNGKVDTCANYRTVDSGSGDLVSSATCNQKLTINGPILAKQLYLKRTHGAGVGADSSTVAETINLPASALMWSYYQSRSYPQAYTTYLRELAPRF